MLRLTSLTPLVLAPFVAAQGTYDFNHLNGSNSTPYVILDGQDNWTSESFLTAGECFVTESMSHDGSESLRFTYVGAGVGCDASRINDSGWSYASFTGAERHAWFETDMQVGTWGGQFALGHDVNGDGQVRLSTPNEIGVRFKLGSVSGAELIAADGTVVNVPLSSAGIANGDWVRVRVIMNLAAASGTGLGTVCVQNLTAGDTSFRGVPGLQFLPLGLDGSATDARNPQAWDALFLHFRGATYGLDNVAVGSDPSPAYDFNHLIGSNAAPLVPLDGQDNWKTQSYQTTSECYVTESMSHDGSKSARFAFAGPGFRCDAWRINDENWGFPNFAANETRAWFEADMQVGFWGGRFGLAHDLNGDSDILETSLTELGVRFELGGNNGVRIFGADNSVVSVPMATTGITQGDWVRVRIQMNLDAAGGTGLGTMFLQNLTAGETSFTEVAGLRNVPLGLDSSASDARNPETWDAVYANLKNNSYSLDNLKVGAGSTPRYHCNDLDGSDVTTVPLDGQDNWTAQSYVTSAPCMVSETMSHDGSHSLRFNSVGAGHGCDASRINDASWGFPRFAGNESHASFQVDLQVTTWGTAFSLAYDTDGNGVIREADADERGVGFQVGLNPELRFIRADGSYVTTTLGAAGISHGDWLRIRVIMNLNGSGQGSMFIQNLTAGNVNYAAVAGMQNVSLALNPLATDATNPKRWDALFTHLEGAGNNIDNFEVVQSVSPASAVSVGSSCPSSGGSNTFAADNLPWTGTTFEATGTGLPLFAFVGVVTGFSQISLPLSFPFPGVGQPGCTLQTDAAFVDFLVSNAGSVSTSLPIPNDPGIVGGVIYQQLIPFEVNASLQFTAITATNSLKLTVGSL